MKTVLRVSKSGKVYRISTKARRKYLARKDIKAKRAEWQRNWNTEHKELVAARAKVKREKNPEKIKAAKAEWYRKNAERIKAARRERYQSDAEFRERVLTSQKSEESRKRIRERKRTPAAREKFNAHRNERLARDLNFKIRSRLGSRLSTAIRSGMGAKSKHTMELVGCTIDFLKNYLEARFTEGMTWERFNAGEIHIDHRIPCVKFDLTDASQQRVCFHYSNLRPAFAFDNLSKHDKMPPTHQAELI